MTETDVQGAMFSAIPFIDELLRTSSAADLVRLPPESGRNLTSLKTSAISHKRTSNCSPTANFYARTKPGDLND